MFISSAEPAARPERGRRLRKDLLIAGIIEVAERGEPVDDRVEPVPPRELPSRSADDAYPTLAQRAGAAISGAVLRLAFVTGAQIVHAALPGALFTEEQPEPGAGIRIALALERAARAPVRVYIQRAREVGMSWPRSARPWAWRSWPGHGGAAWAKQRGSTQGSGQAFLSGQLAIFRWTCPDCGEVVGDRGPSGGRLPVARGRRRRWPRPTDSASALTTSRPRPPHHSPTTVNLDHNYQHPFAPLTA